MEAIQVISRDHREIERLFKEFERADRAEETNRQAAAVRELVRELSIHAAIEEQFLYPALRAAGADPGVLEALEEHHAVKVTLAELEALPPSNARFAPKVRLLAVNVRRHVAEEERALLPQLERALDEEARRALGEALERARRAAPTRPHPAAPDTPPGSFIAGAVAAVYDRSRDALRGGTAMLRTIGEQGASRTLDAAKGLASRARRRGRAAVDGAAEQGRVVVQAGVRKGREVMDDARETTARVELRGAEAASTVARKASTVARKGRSAARSTRAAGRSRAGARAGSKARRRRGAAR